MQITFFNSASDLFEISLDLHFFLASRPTHFWRQDSTITTFHTILGSDDLKNVKENIITIRRMGCLRFTKHSLLVYVNHLKKLKPLRFYVLSIEKCSFFYDKDEQIASKLKNVLAPIIQPENGDQGTVGDGPI